MYEAGSGKPFAVDTQHKSGVKSRRHLAEWNVPGCLESPKSVTLNDLQRRNGPYFALFHQIFVYDIVAKQLLGLPRFQNVLLKVSDHIKTICAIIQRLFEQKN